MERYNLGYHEIDTKELYKLLEANYRYGIQTKYDRVMTNFVYRDQLLKTIYNPKEKVLVTVHPIHENLL